MYMAYNNIITEWLACILIPMILILKNCEHKFLNFQSCYHVYKFTHNAINLCSGGYEYKQLLQNFGVPEHQRLYDFLNIWNMW